MERQARHSAVRMPSCDTPTQRASKRSNFAPVLGFVALVTAISLWILFLNTVQLNVPAAKSTQNDVQTDSTSAVSVVSAVSPVSSRFAWDQDQRAKCLANKNVKTCLSMATAAERHLPCDVEACPWTCGACASFDGPQRKLNATLPQHNAADIVPYTLDEGIDFGVLKSRALTSEDEWSLLLEGVPGVWPATTKHALCNHPKTPVGDIVSKLRTAELSPAAASLRVMCLVYTLGRNRATKLESQRRTWGHRCDGFAAMSDVWDPVVPSVALAHEGREDWHNMWQKSRAIWAWAHLKHIENYDYFVMGGDDMYVNIDNLKHYLQTLDKTKPLYVGRSILQPNAKVRFNAGGAGYTLSRPALKILGEKLDNPACNPHGVFSWEDVQVSQCLDGSGVSTIDTRDGFNSERFHPLAHFHLPQITKKDWLFFYSRDFRAGAQGVSNESVSFHYLRTEDFRTLHAAFHLCR
eukprot:TRINITY_DN15030_c0_g1_i1.p1 TRINITY_DN15030_c0_g1~~TRINITY_DN15030_c0_g1_i1.p1  ORF type:complete len:498 (+),score=82.68 TRINITY_DN15030_c0_g1_i1:102-1496(+)